MAEQPDLPPSSPPQRSASPAEIAAALLPRSLGVKVGILIAVTVMVIGGFVTYVLFARGVFEATQGLVLITDNAEGVGIGTDLTFAGFPIGRVRRIDLQDDGKVRVSVRVPVSEAKWLRESRGGVSLKMDSVLAKAEQRVFGQAGVVDETQKAVAQTNAILGEVRESLRKVDLILADAQATAGNAKAASADLGVLRAEVDASLRKLAALIDEINRKWPFERDTKIKLP